MSDALSPSRSESATFVLHKALAVKTAGLFPQVLSPLSSEGVHVTSIVDRAVFARYAVVRPGRGVNNSDFGQLPQAHIAHHGTDVPVEQFVACRIVESHDSAALLAELDVLSRNDLLVTVFLDTATAIAVMVALRLSLVAPDGISPAVLMVRNGWPLPSKTSQDESVALACGFNDLGARCP